MSSNNGVSVVFLDTIKAVSIESKDGNVVNFPNGISGSYSANSLTGTLPNSVLSGNYTGLASLTLSGEVSFTAKSNGANLVNFFTERPWYIKTYNTGISSGTYLAIENYSGKTISFSAGTPGQQNISLNADDIGAEIRINGSSVWHSGNDGDGSGLHADVLDGQHGSYYRSRTNHTGTQLANTISDLSSAVDIRIGLQKANASGLATLDGSGKVPSSQLPADGSYKGTWNASTNNPTIANAVGTTGDFYFVSTAGNTNIGGNTVWIVGDQIRYNGSGWQKIPSAVSVTSVAGKTGSVTLVKADVGLGNVDNTSDLDKPISTTTQSALDAKAATNHTHTSANSTTSGFMSASDKVKLDGIDTNANLYVHPSGDGNLHVPATGTTNNNKYLKAGSTAGSLSWSTITFGELTSKPTTLTGYGITDAQPLNTILTAISTLDGAADTLLYFTGDEEFDITTLSSFGRSLIDDANASAARTTLGLPSIVGTITGISNGVGIIGSSTSGNVILSLSNTGIAAANYGSATQSATFRTDAQGRIVSASNQTITPSWAVITDKPTVFTPDAHVHSAADLTSGTVPNARVDGSYTNIKSLKSTSFTIEGPAPTITLTSNSIDPTFKNWWMRGADHVFYILADRDGDDVWEVPHPLVLNMSSNSGTLFGNTILTATSSLDATKLTGSIAATRLSGVSLTGIPSIAAATMNTSGGFTAASTTNGSVVLGTDGNGNIEVGKSGRTTAGFPFIDFHSSQNSPDYDVRIQAFNGVNTSTGTANLHFFADVLKHRSGNVILHTGNYDLATNRVHITDSKFAGGADPTGTSDCKAAIQAAIDYVYNLGGGTVVIPPGRFKCSKVPFDRIDMKSNVTIQGYGDASCLYFDDSPFIGRMDLFNLDKCWNVTFKEFLFEGSLDNYLAYAQQNASIFIESTVPNTSATVGNIQFLNMHFRKGRYIGMAIDGAQGILWDGCLVTDFVRDAIRMTTSWGVRIVNNIVMRVGDDCISLHIAEPNINLLDQFSQVNIVQGNITILCQGMKMAGAKSLDVSNNLCILGLRNPIQITQHAPEGTSSQSHISIHHNMVLDALYVGYSTNDFAIRIDGFARNTTLGNTLPGYNSPPYDYNYIHNVDQSNVVNIGNFAISIHDNIVMRTRPNVNAVSEYGFGKFLSHGDIVGIPFGYYDPPVLSNNFVGHGLEIAAPIGNLLIHNNIFSGLSSPERFPVGILISQNAANNRVDLFNTVISNNIFHDIPYVGIGWSPSPLTSIDVSIINNTFDLDPYFRNTNHRANNSWTANGACMAISNPANARALVGQVSLNRFKNMSQITDFTVENLMLDDSNLAYADFIIHTASDSNKGIRHINVNFPNKWIPIYGDPTDLSTYGKVRNIPVIAATIMPTSGRYAAGHFVRKLFPAAPLSPNVTFAYWRVTTGENHVAGVDWLELTAGVKP